MTANIKKNHWKKAIILSLPVLLATIYKITILYDKEPVKTFKNDIKNNNNIVVNNHIKIDSPKQKSVLNSTPKVIVYESKPKKLSQVPKLLQKEQSYSFCMENLPFGSAFFDPITTASISVLSADSNNVATTFASAPRRRFAFNFDDTFLAKPSQKWHFYCQEKQYLLILSSVNYIKKTFSARVIETEVNI